VPEIICLGLCDIHDRFPLQAAPSELTRAALSLRAANPEILKAISSCGVKADKARAMHGAAFKCIAVQRHTQLGGSQATDPDLHVDGLAGALVVALTLSPGRVIKVDGRVEEVTPTSGHLYGMAAQRHGHSVRMVCGETDVTSLAVLFRLGYPLDAPHLTKDDVTTLSDALAGALSLHGVKMPESWCEADSADASDAAEKAASGGGAEVGAPAAKHPRYA
jgi:hypothetical protein